MRKFLKAPLSVILTAALLSTSAYAGILIDQQMTCPVGGEAFSVDGTASCSSMGRMLSLKPITSCDFITRLPVCPTNKLPMYREFNDNEVKSITAFMQTNEYRDALSKPVYIRAYLLSKTLEDDKSLEPFLLLQSALWYGQASAQISVLYKKEFQQARTNMEESDLPFWLGAASFEAWSSQDLETATQHLQEAKSLADPENKYLGSYIKRLDDCYNGNLSGEDCLATTDIPRK